MGRTMRLIKRYPNRKLYDTVEKQYVTLHDVASLIRQGYEVQVLDHVSGEDLTAITLTQIISEQEKRQAGFLPRAVLRGLVEAGGERLSTLRRALAMPLGLSQQVDEEIERRIRLQVRDGTLAEGEARHLRSLLMDEGLGAERDAAGASSPALPEEALERVMRRMGLPSSADVHELDERLDRLLEDIDAILAHRERGSP
jgi:polyhydroxyalkanoate synthesis repressor PhaR